VLDLLGDATIVKLNKAEAETLADLLGTTSTTPALATALAARHGVEAVCVTRGPDGASLWIDGQELSVDGMPIDVTDTVGAGDAFAAGLLHGRLAVMSTADTLAFANRLGALVASRPGALPPWRVDELA
jgi:fructokinase